MLNIPYVFARTSEKYEIPLGIEDNILINRSDRDYGPGTKVIPTVKYLKDNNFNPVETRIIYLDDDVIYPLTMLETMKNMSHDNSVYVGSGFNFGCLNGTCDNILAVRTHNATAQVAEGYAAVCIRLDSFADDFMEYINMYIDNLDFYLSDDVVLSNYYCSRGIAIKLINVPKKFCIKDIWLNKGILNYGMQDDALHNGANGTSVNNVKRYKVVLAKLQADGNRYIT